MPFCFGGGSSFLVKNPFSKPSKKGGFYIGGGPNRLPCPGDGSSKCLPPRSPSSSVHCSQPCTDHRNSLSPMASWALFAASSYGRWAGSKGTAWGKTRDPFWWSLSILNMWLYFWAFWCKTTQGVLILEIHLFWHLVGCHHILLPTNMEMHMIHMFPRIDDFMCSESASRFDLRFMPFPYSAISDHWIKIQTLFFLQNMWPPKFQRWVIGWVSFMPTLLIHYPLMNPPRKQPSMFILVVVWEQHCIRGLFISMQYHPIFGRIPEKGAGGERHHSRNFQHT